MSAKPAGRRPGDPQDTRRDILDAARSTFSEMGFERATIRTIATLADVDPALVMHHFGSKQDLFVAAHELPVSPAAVIEALAAIPHEQRGAEIVRTYVDAIGAPGSHLFSLLRAAATNDGAARMLREFVQEALLSHADEIVRGPDAQLRLALIGSHLIGMVFGRTIVGIPPLAQASVDELVALVGPVVQGYLTDPQLPA